MTDVHPDLVLQRQKSIHSIAQDTDLADAAQNFMRLSSKHGYVYNYDWLGRPIIQFPQDIVAMQELIWHTKPDVIIETGVAHGGSLVLCASMLALLDMADASKTDCGSKIDRRVIGIDIDIRAHNRSALESHPFYSYINLIEGSSIDEGVADMVKSLIPQDSKVLVSLDSNHTHVHVLDELRLYASLVTVGSYCIVWDTSIEFDSSSTWSGKRSWGKGNSPHSALMQFIRESEDFEIDTSVNNKFLITVAPQGFLKRIR